MIWPKGHFEPSPSFREQDRKQRRVAGFQPKIVFGFVLQKSGNPPEPLRATSPRGADSHECCGFDEAMLRAGSGWQASEISRWPETRDPHPA